MISIQQLNEIRLDKSVTITIVAKDLGISRQQASKLLSGKANATVDQFITICNTLNIDTAFLYK